MESQHTNNWYSLLTVCHIDVSIAVGYVNPIQVAAQSNAPICARSLAGIEDSNPSGGMDIVSCERCVLSGRGLCDSTIPCKNIYRECETTLTWKFSKTGQNSWRQTIQK
jgi:hypothetical protein